MAKVVIWIVVYVLKKQQSDCQLFLSFAINLDVMLTISVQCCLYIEAWYENKATTALIRVVREQVMYEQKTHCYKTRFYIQQAYDFKKLEEFYKGKDNTTNFENLKRGLQRVKPFLGTE